MKDTAKNNEETQNNFGVNINRQGKENYKEKRNSCKINKGGKNESKNKFKE